MSVGLNKVTGIFVSCRRWEDNTTTAPVHSVVLYPRKVRTRLRNVPRNGLNDHRWEPTQQ